MVELDDTVKAARMRLVHHALDILMGEVVPVPRRSLFVVPDQFEEGTEAYKALADEMVESRWQNQALARLFEYGFVARQRVSRGKVLYAKTERTSWALEGVEPNHPSGLNRANADPTLVVSAILGWAVDGEPPAPPIEPKHYELDPPSKDAAPDAMGVGRAPDESEVEEQAGDEVAEEDTFEYLVAQTLNTIRKRLQKVEDRLTQQQRSLDNMLSTSRKLADILESQQERSEQGAERTARVIEAVDKLEQAASTIGDAAREAENRALFTVASRFHAMVQEGEALQSILFDALSKREKTESG